MCGYNGSVSSVESLHQEVSVLVPDPTVSCLDDPSHLPDRLEDTPILSEDSLEPFDPLAPGGLWRMRPFLLPEQGGPARDLGKLETQESFREPGVLGLVGNPLVNHSQYCWLGQLYSDALVHFPGSFCLPVGPEPLAAVIHGIGCNYHTVGLFGF